VNKLATLQGERQGDSGPRPLSRWIQRVALVLMLAVIAWVLSISLGGSNTSATGGDRSATVDVEPIHNESRRRRASVPAYVPPPPVDGEDTAGEPLYVDGWPAAEILVRKADGTPAVRATVYVLPARGVQSNELWIPTRITHADGIARVAAASAGRYDVGAFFHGELGVLSMDIDLPARAPVEIVLEIVLPELSSLSIERADGVPDTAFVTISRAHATRVAFYPGRGESRSIFGRVSELVPGILVPRGVSLSVGANQGVVAAPSEVIAPGDVSLSTDGRTPVSVEFVFLGAEDLAGKWFTFEFEYERVCGDESSVIRERITLAPRAGVTTSTRHVRCLAGSNDVGWSIVRGRTGLTTIDVASMGGGSQHRVEVPVSLNDFTSSSRAFAIRPVSLNSVQRGTLSILTPSAEMFWALSVAPNDECWIEAADIEYVAAIVTRRSPPLVAGPALPSTSTVSELALVEGAYIRLSWLLPAGADPTWPLRVRRSDGVPLMLGDPTPVMVPEALIRVPHQLLGPFPPGEVELVFRFGDRDVGRRTVRIVAGPPIPVAAPTVEQPPR